MVATRSIGFDSESTCDYLAAIDRVCVPTGECVRAYGNSGSGLSAVAFIAAFDCVYAYKSRASITINGVCAYSLEPFVTSGAFSPLDFSPRTYLRKFERCIGITATYSTTGD